MNLNNIRENIKKNIEISNQYLSIYPCLVQHEDIREIIRLKGNSNVPKELHAKSSKLWDQFKPLKLYGVANFLYNITEDSEKYLTGELVADPLEVLQEIKTDIDEYLNQPEFDPKNDRYYHEDHKSALEMQEIWSKVNTKEDFFKVITGDSFEYTTFGDFCPFHNTNKNRKAKLTSIVIENKLAYEDDNALDLELKMLGTLLQVPNIEKANKDIAQYEEDQKVINDIIESLLPLCERAKKIDDCWENNFLSNKILSEIKNRMKK